MDKVIPLGIVGAALFVALRLLQMKNVSDNVTVRLLRPRIHKVDLGGLTFQTEVVLNNPTRDMLSLTTPVVTLSSAGKVLAQSDSVGLIYTVAPLAVTELGTISLNLPWTVLGGLASGIIKRIPEIMAEVKKGGDVAKAIGVPIEMRFSTYAGGVFYQSPTVKIL
jgi:hypothetical protein